VSDTPHQGGAAGSGPEGTPTTPPRKSRTASTRRSARRTAPAAESTRTGSVLERYRGVLLAAAAAVVIGLVAIFVLQPSGPAYACDSLLTPGPTDPPPAAAATPAVTGASPASIPPPPPVGGVPRPASPAPGDTGTVAGPSPSPQPEPTPRLGFATRDLGRGHVSPNESIRYAFCPPTSGTHWNAAVRRAFYNPGDRMQPGQWVHNLEHGYVVIAYRGEPGATELAAAREVMDAAAPSDIAVQCGLPNKVMAVRFDDMAEPWAVLAWDRALLMTEFDPEAARIFAEQWQDSPQTPEQAC
jgi:hypothetical protein